jgi:hypothetical protein
MRRFDQSAPETKTPRFAAQRVGKSLSKTLAGNTFGCDSNKNAVSFGY